MRVSYFYDMPLPAKYAAAIQILNTSRALAEDGVPVTVWVRNIEGSEREALEAYGLTPHPLLSLRPFFGTLPWKLSPTRALRRALEKFDARQRHFIVSRGECGVQLYPAVARIGESHAACRWVYEAHRLCGGEGTNASEGHLRLPLVQVRALERAAVTNAAGLICLTPAVQEALRALYPLPRSVLILPSGAPAPSAAPAGDEQRDIDVLYAGKLERRKGILDLVRAMQHLPEYRAHVAGGSPAEVGEVHAEAIRYGVEERIDLPGFVEPAKADALYHRARVGVCPLPAGESAVSEHFTSPLKLLAMMAAGVPVVATALPSVERIMRHEVSGLLVPPGDAAAMAAAIRRLLEDRALAARLTSAALEAVREYSWENRARRLKEFLLTLR